MEDNPLTLEITTHVLNSFGLKVTAVLNAKKALEVLDAQSFDLILLDWKLPDLVGLDLVEAIEKHNQNFDHLIIFTGYDADYLSTGLSYQVVNKPLIKQDLVRVISNCFSGNSGEVEEREGNEEAVSEHIQDYSHLKILLVEDNEINTLIALDILHEMKIQVECATTGFQAVDKVKEGEFDMVLMDIQMPEMDGMEATKIIRESKTDKQLPIIALTANVLREEVQIYLDVGMNHHIGKPFERKELESVIKMLGNKLA